MRNKRRTLGINGLLTAFPASLRQKGLEQPLGSSGRIFILLMQTGREVSKFVGRLQISGTEASNSDGGASRRGASSFKF